MPIFFGKPKRIRKKQVQRIRPPAQIYPRMLEKQYQRLLSTLFYQLRDIMEAELFPHLEDLGREFSREFGVKIRQDEFIGTLTKIIAGIKVRFAGKVDKMQPEIMRIGSDVDKWNKDQHKKAILTVMGVNILEADRSMSSAVDLWTKQNVSLCVNLMEGEARIIEQMVADAFRNGHSWRELRDALLDHWKDRDERGTNWVKGFSVPYRARLVARDQIGKLNGQVSKMRQTNIGVGRYIWRTSLDERVRESHRALEGQIFHWNSEDGRQPPAEIGHPGNDYQCRCYAEPLIDDLFELDDDGND